jgi:succinylglutamic semialdehyde dehydrogenase
MSQNTHYINGQWIIGEGEQMNSVDPAKNEVVWSGNSASAEQVDAAIQAAREAFISWSLFTFEARIDIVKKFADLLGEHKT